MEQHTAFQLTEKLTYTGPFCWLLFMYCGAMFHLWQVWLDVTTALLLLAVIFATSHHHQFGP